MADRAADLARAVLDLSVATRVFPAAVAEVGDSRAVLWSQPVGQLTFDRAAGRSTAPGAVLRPRRQPWAGRGGRQRARRRPPRLPRLRRSRRRAFTHRAHSAARP